MASYRKRARTWRAEVCLYGVRESATRNTKAEAVAWATALEAEIRAKRRGQIIPRTLADALRRYATEVSPQKRGARWEQIRLAKLEREIGFAARMLEDVRPSDIAEWRNRALTVLAPASVRREMVLLRSVFELARREWGWLHVNPMAEIAWPSAGAARNRRISDAESAALVLALGLGDGIAARPSQRVAVAFLWALETAMRAGEIVGLRWADIDVDGRCARLPRTKNGEARSVPLSRAALALLDRLPRDEKAPVFGLTSASLDTLFRKARRRAGIEGLTFHDTRHEAVTRLARKLDVLNLARMIGHRDLKSLQIYFNPTASEIAARLD